MIFTALVVPEWLIRLKLRYLRNIILRYSGWDCSRILCIKNPQVTCEITCGLSNVIKLGCSLE